MSISLPVSVLPSVTPPTNGSFPRSRRLTCSASFDAVFKHNDVRISRRNLLVLARRNNGSETRLGMVVGKKVAPRAVARNRIKRLVRESFRRHAWQGSFDLIVLARPGLPALGNTKLLTALAAIWMELDGSHE